MSRRAFSIFASAAALLAMLGSSPALGEGYAVWDKFDGVSVLDTDRWLFPERSRWITGGTLNMVQRDYGSQVGDTGFYNSSWSTALANPAAVTQLRATVKVNSHAVTGCAANPGAAAITARVFGSFFNAGPIAGPGRINDVGAVLGLVRESDSTDPPGTLRVVGRMFKCTTEDCNYGTVDLGSVDLGTTTEGTAVSLWLEWDVPNNRFLFRKGSSDPKQSISYAGMTVNPPSAGHIRLIGTRNNVPNCFTGPRASAFVSASFDNVAVNASAVP